MTISNGLKMKPDNYNTVMGIAFAEAFVKDALQKATDDFVEGFKEFIGDGIYIGAISKEELICRGKTKE